MTELMVKIENVNGILVTTSNRVAEELGVEHKNLIRKIEDYIIKFGSSNLSREFYIESTFENRGKKYKNYLITKKGIAQLIGGYSSAVERAFEINVAYINEFERMENYINENRGQHTLEEELLLNIIQSDTKEEKALAVQEYRERIIKPLQLENKKQKEYIDHVVINEKYYITPSQIGNKFQKSAKALNKILNDIGIIYKRGKKWYLTSDYYGIADYRYFQKPNGEWEKGDNLCYSNEGEKLIFEILIAHGYEPIKVA